MKLSHEVLLALVYVSQISDPEAVKRRFIESLNGLDDAFSFAYSDHLPRGFSESRAMPIATLHSTFGYALMPENARVTVAEEGIFRSAFKFLAILLENRMQARMLASRNESLVKEVQTEKSLVRTVLETLPVGVWVADETGTILTGNTANETIWGGNSAGGNAWRPESDEPLAEEDWGISRSIRDGKTTLNQEIDIGCSDGTRKTILHSAAPILNEEKKVIGAIGVNQDITERKKSEKERKKLQAQLNQSQKMESVGRLAGGVAHDFNNMLGIILGNTEMALEQLAPVDPVYANLEEIRSAANRSADLVRQLLAFARKQTIAPKVLDLNATVEGMLKMLRRLVGENIDVAWLPGSNIGPVMMDPSQIDQILANLCVNSRDAIKDVGRITIETGKAAFDEAYCSDHAGFIPGEYVLLAVSDDGCGMPPETLKNLFEPFFTTKDIGKGTGLGLATVYGIVKQNSGFINVYSEPGKGTTFRIYLSRHEAPGEQTRRTDPAAADAGGSETVLLVEDEQAILKMTTLMLERLGYRVLGARAPGEAIRLAREHSGEIHLLMTDVVMPEMNGRELAKNLLTIYPNLKILFMSGYTANVIAHHGILDEGVNFIQKPFSRQDLSSVVRKSLTGKP